MQNDFPTRFDAASLEPKIYQKWVDSGAFSPDSCDATETRSILMPPPNANGALHVGHSYEVAIQDTLIRYWRMRGYKTLWQPGMDHAGFETQIVFERKLEKEGRSRFGMPREELYKEIFEYTTSFQPTVQKQFERLGASADWSRFRFMLDEPLVQTVYDTFKELYEDGLVYRGKRPVHWCTKHQTTLSDLEVGDEERVDPLYYIKYGPLVLATVRPETKFGDTALAVHPDDERYKAFVGREIEIETLLGPTKIKVIADEYVKPEFGTGVVKITPAHDPNDYEVAQRHDLPLKVVIDQYGKLNELAGPYAGLKIAEARAKIVADMQDKGLIEKIDETYTHTVKVCYKCKNVIEPRVIDQWWLAVTKPSQKYGKSLRDMAVEAVKSGETTFVTERFENQFYAWMNGLRDWPLSRQIVWGIQLPVWYGADGSVVVTDGAEPDNAHNLTRDNDVFDTWFSSCQWPFSTLGSHPGDLETFYPTTAMCPGYDILPFWVARMMMLSLFTQGKSPYKVINLHGMVRDAKGQKMSKSKGNVVDPLTVVDQYGADALRLALLYGSAPGTDPSIGDDKVKGMRNFTTKLWNITRFMAMNTETTTKAEFVPMTDADHAIAKRLHATIEEVTKACDAFQLHLALESLYQFIWHDVADTYLEATKAQLEDAATKDTTQGNLRYVVEQALTLAHPFAPFVTEGLWSQIKGGTELLMTTRWPHGAT